MPQHFIRHRLDADFDPSIVAQIDQRLDEAESTHAVHIPWAIESGSRAWGFPSPDSDYDCRFIYLRSRDSYLGLFQPRDVIETPLTEVLDVNGWDLAKALKLMLKGNAAVVEWLTSPHVYRGDPAFRDGMIKLANEIVGRDRIAKHYLHLAYSMRNKVFAGDSVELKKLFYIIRPAIVLRWLRQRPKSTVAPMNFPTLCDQTRLPKAVHKTIWKLIELKAVTRELGHGPVPPELRKLTKREIWRAESAFGDVPGATPDQIALADAFFREALDRWAPPSRA